MVNAVLTLILNQKMGFSASEVSYFMVILGIMYMLFSMLGGKLSDKYNKKYCIICCDVISVILYLVCSFIELSFVSLILISIAAVMQYMESPIYDALITDITTPENRQKAFALQYLGINLGILFAPTLAGLLFKKHLMLLFLISSISIGMSTILIATLVKNIEPEKVVSIKEKSRDGDSVLKILSENKILFAYLFLMGLYSAVYSECGYLMPLDLGRMYGEDGAIIYGTMNSTNCFIVVIFSTVFLYIFSGIKPQHKMNIAQLLIAIGYIIYVIFIDRIPAYYVAITLFTFGEIFATLGSQPFFTSMTPASHRGRINGVREVLRQGLNSIMMIISGQIYDKKGYMVSWNIVIITIIVVVILTFLLNLKLGKKKI